MPRPIGTFGMAVVALLCGLLLWVVDVFVGGLSLGFILAYGGMVALVLALFLRRGARLVRGGILLAFLAWLPLVHLAEWSSREPFLRDLAQVQPGMSRSDVAEIMGAYIRGTGWPANPTSSGSVTLQDAGTGNSYVTDDSDGGELSLRGCEVFRHSNEGAYDSDWGIVCYERDRVSRVDFSHD